MIEKLIDQAVATLQPIDRPGRLGVQCDLSAALTRSKDFVEPEIVVSADPRCIFDARATVADHVESLQDVGRALDRIFSMIQYGYFRASSRRWFREATVLRFVTSPKEGGYFVTGRIHVAGGPYATLVERFDGAYGWDGPLPSLGQSGEPDHG